MSATLFNQKTGEILEINNNVENVLANKISQFLTTTQIFSDSIRAHLNLASTQNNAEEKIQTLQTALSLIQSINNSARDLNFTITVE